MFSDLPIFYICIIFCIIRIGGESSRYWTVGQIVVRAGNIIPNCIVCIVQQKAVHQSS